jgi:hypothetical protein
MVEQTTKTYLDFGRWLRRCRHFWSHYRLRSVVLEARDVPRRALWTDIVLADSDAEPEPVPGELTRARDIKIITSVGSYAKLPILLRSLRSGQLPNWATGESTPIPLSWKADAMVAVSQFSLDPSPEAFAIKDPLKKHQGWAQYPRGVLTFEVGLLSPWWNARDGRYQWLVGLDDQARRTGCRDLFDLGQRLGLLGDIGSNSSSNAVPQLRVVAPYLVKISGATVDRKAGALTVDVVRSHRLVSHSIEVTLVETDRSDPLRPAVVLVSGTNVSARFEGIRGGHAELRLHDDVCDSFSRRQGILREPCRRSARSAVAGVLEGGLGPLKAALEKAQGAAIEPALTRLLFLLGWSCTSLSRNASQPAGMPDGLMRFDILAFGKRDSILLAVECSSDWFGDDKLAKLVTRSRELGSVLAKGLAPSDVPCVQPALVVTKERAVAPPHLLAAAENHGVGVIAREDLLDLVTYLGGDEPPQSLSERFATCFPQGSWLGPPNTIHEFGKYETW